MAEPRDRDKAKDESKRRCIERWVVRVSIGALFLASGLFACLFTISKDAAGHDKLPSVALGQAPMFRIEIALAVVYSGLLLFTPLFYGLAQGLPPNEISPRGAKWPAAATETLQGFERSLDTLRSDSTDLRARLVEQQLEMDRVKAELERLPVVPKRSKLWVYSRR
ncbi:MAG TPA: hypothetical protein VK272_09185 [Solirubrobacteraceae bacterium]|nr:hypothetical protein [Solirubrobacteraceae bacterium]